MGKMQKVSQQKGVPTEIEMKTFLSHKTWNCDLIFYNSANSVLLVQPPGGISSSWLSHKSHRNRMSHKFIEVEHLRYQKNHFKLYRLVTKTYICLRIRVRSRLSKTRYILKACRLDYRKLILKCIKDQMTTTS